jgi:CubicO group peptidase (beta-lactamase class C family)
LRDVDPTHLATPYGWAGRRYYVETLEGFAFYPSNSMRVSITGLARFTRMWLLDGELDGVRVLQPETVQAALEIQYPRISSSRALTWRTSRLGSRTYYGHSGITFGGSANVLFSPEEDRGLVLLANSDAYLRGEIGLPEGDEALGAILLRLDEETF